MDKRKFNRVPEDTSQQESFVKNVIDKLNNCATKEYVDSNKAPKDILNLEIKTESFESFFTKTIDKDGNFNFDLVKTIPNGLYIYHPEPNIISNFEFEQYITMIVFGDKLNEIKEKLNDLFYSITPYPNPTTSFAFSTNNQYKEYYIYVIGSIIYIDEYWEV